MRPVPKQPFGYRLRVTLDGTVPPVWRDIKVPGRIHLDTLHVLLQSAMGWNDSHLHQFRQGSDRQSPVFLTDFDVVEGDPGTREADVRLDQVIAEAGDKLGYLYDYGDNWGHTITVEEALDTPPAVPSCVGGARACPPEDVGGVDTFEELSSWVRAGPPESYDARHFDPEIIGDWLEPGWHPDTFAADETSRVMQEAWASHVRLATELSQLLASLPMMEGAIAESFLEDETWILHTPGNCPPTSAMLAPFITFLEVIGDGVKLTATNRLRRDVLRRYAEASGIAEWWPRALTSEASVPPVAEVHELARELGLVYLRHGRLRPTSKAQQLGDDPASWLNHLSDKLPLGRTQFDRHAGWSSLLVAGTDIEFEEWKEYIANTLADIGWLQVSGGLQLAPAPYNPTLTLLEILVRGLDEVYLADPDTAPSEEQLESHRRAVAALARQAVLEKDQV